MGTSVFGPFDQKFVINNFIDNVTKVSGRHTLKAGIYYQRASNRSNSQTNVEANIDFTSSASNPLNSGYPFANALLGVYSSYTQASSKPEASYYYYDLSGYIQDTWKATPHLTLDLGLRLVALRALLQQHRRRRLLRSLALRPVEGPTPLPSRVHRPALHGQQHARDGSGVSGPPTAANTLGSFFIGKLVPNSGDLTNGMGLTANGYLRGGIEGQAVLPQPRLGFSWDVSGQGKMVVRGGFGISFDRYQTGIGVGSGATNQPFVFNPTLINGYLQDLSSEQRGALAPQSVQGVDPQAKWPAIYSYSLGVQREIGKGIVVDVAYVGLAVAPQPAPREPERAALRHDVQGLVAGPDPDGRRRARGRARPASGLSPTPASASPAPTPTPSTSCGRTRATATSSTTYFDGRTSYNSLQVALQRRFSKRFTFGVAYTLSRANTTVSDDATFTNNLDPESFDYGLATFDRTHYFVLNYVWNLPKGGKLLGGGWLARALLDNWTLSGISWMASGNPAELTLSIAGQDAGNRLLGTYTNGNGAGLQPRFRVNGDAQNAPERHQHRQFHRPRHRRCRPLSALLPAQPRLPEPRPVRLQELPAGGERKAHAPAAARGLQRPQHPQFSAVNRTTNVTNAAGQTGAAIFNNYTGLTVTNNTRPAGSTAVHGDLLRRVHRDARSAHHPARGEAVLLRARFGGGVGLSRRLSTPGRP